MKIKITAVTAAIALVLTGCQKDDISSMTGSYTYKTSGFVTLVPEALASLTPEQLAMYKLGGGTVDTLTLALAPEQGQLNIVVKDKSQNLVLASWNDVLGNVCTADAEVNGKTLSLQLSSKSAQLTDGTNTIGAGIVLFAGDGTLYDNMLVIPMQYSGTFSVSNVSMSVIASSIQCVAKAN